MSSNGRRSASSADAVTAAHKRRWRQWAQLVAAGGVRCAREDCPFPGRLIQPGQAWDLDHSDDRTAILGPSHRSCNRRAGARKMTAQRATATGARPPKPRDGRLCRWDSLRGAWVRQSRDWLGAA